MLLFQAPGVDNAVAAQHLMCALLSLAPADQVGTLLARAARQSCSRIHRLPARGFGSPARRTSHPTQSQIRHPGRAKSGCRPHRAPLIDCCLVFIAFRFCVIRPHYFAYLTRFACANRCTPDAIQPHQEFIDFLVSQSFFSAACVINPTIYNI